MEPSFHLGRLSAVAPNDPIALFGSFAAATGSDGARNTRRSDSIGKLWRVAGGDVRVAVDEAEWWGASLSVLIAAVHHPDALATCHPENDPVEVGRDVLADIAELYAAAAVADAHSRRADPGDRPASVWVRRDGAEIVFAPGAEMADLARCLELFASAVVDPGGADAAVARGATAYAAAWSVDVGRASGTLSAVDPPRRRGTSSDPAAVNRSHDRRAASDHGARR